MDGHLPHNRIRGVVTAAALAFTLVAAPGASADETTPSWLSAVGNFVRDGLAPPRTAEDLQREEGRQADSPAAPAPAPARVAAPLPAPVVEPEPAQAVPAPEPKAADGAAPAVAPVANNAPRPAAPAEVKPRPATPAVTRTVVPLPPPPPPEPLTGSRIAATATLDQAMKLGGPAGLYAQRVKKPQSTP